MKRLRTTPERLTVLKGENSNFERDFRFGQSNVLVELLQTTGIPILRQSVEVVGHIESLGEIGVDKDLAGSRRQSFASSIDPTSSGNSVCCIHLVGSSIVSVIYFPCRRITSDTR